MRALAGWSLVGLGIGLWIAVPVVLALSIDGGLKATVVGALLVVAEIAFWAGAVLLGIGLFARLQAAYVRRLGSRGEAAGEDDGSEGSETEGSETPAFDVTPDRSETPGRGETPSPEADKGESWT